MTGYSSLTSERTGKANPRHRKKKRYPLALDSALKEDQAPSFNSYSSLASLRNAYFA